MVERQAALIARWMGVGFIHGVMNTDNMTISGETIDYGPCAFLEAYDPNQRFSSIDHHGRYAFGRQPSIAQWNLARLAETLLPLIDADGDRAVARATEVVEGFAPKFEAQVLRVLCAKFGFDEQPDARRRRSHDRSRRAGADGGAAHRSHAGVPAPERRSARCARRVA